MHPGGAAVKTHLDELLAHRVGEQRELPLETLRQRGRGRPEVGHVRDADDEIQVRAVAPPAPARPAKSGTKGGRATTKKLGSCKRTWRNTARVLSDKIDLETDPEYPPSRAFKSHVSKITVYP